MKAIVVLAGATRLFVALSVKKSWGAAAMLTILPLALPGQDVPPQYRFAGYKPLEEPHSLAALLESPAIAAIPGTGNEASVLNGASGKLFRLNYTDFRMTEINVTPSMGSLGQVNSMAVDKNGVLYLPDPSRNRVLRILPNGTASLFAGTGNDNPSGDGGLAVRASLRGPRSTALDPSGNVYIAEDFLVRKVDTQGRITTFAGCFGTCPSGPLGTNRTIRPAGLAVDRRGNLYLADNDFFGRGRVYVLNPAGVMVEIKQSGDPAAVPLPAPYTSFGGLAGLLVTADGSVLVTDLDRNVVWKIGNNGYTSILIGRVVVERVTVFGGTIETIAGDYYGNGPLTGYEHFSSPRSISLDGTGRLLIADEGNSAIRLLTPKESLITVAGQRRCCYREEGIPASEATIEFPRGLASDRDGNIYVADPRAGRVRKIDRSGRITTILGNGSLAAKTGVPALETGAQPYGVAVDSRGNIYVAEPGLRMIRRVTLNGFVESVAGPQSGVFPLRLTQTPSDGAVAVGPDDALYYLAGCNVHRWTGRPEALLSGTCLDSPDGPSRSSSVDKPTTLAVGGDGAVYIGASSSTKLRVVRNGRLETLGNVSPSGDRAFPNALHYAKNELLFVTGYSADNNPDEYRFAFALSRTGQRFPISTNYLLPYRTGALISMTTDAADRVIIGQADPPQLLVFPKVLGGN